MGDCEALISQRASAEEETEESTVRLKRRFRSGPTLKDDLSAMVKEDPDAAATILRNWINSAG